MKTERIIGTVGGYLLIEKYTLLGYPYVVWRKPMPRVTDDLLLNVAYLYPSERDAKEGIKAGGTGFIVRVQTAVMYYEYVVTNRHVVEKENSRWVRLNTHAGKIDAFEGEWELSDTDDLAACEMPLHRAHFKYRSVDTEWLLTRDDTKRLDIGLGDDLFLAGRFINHDGKERNLPVVRFGTIAMMPHPSEPLIADGKPQESFLIEIRTIPGFSGSPVFVHMPWETRKKTDRFKPNPRELHFLETHNYLEKVLGIEWCRVKGETATTPTINGATYDIQITSGMSGCIPAWKILDFLTTNETFMDQRKATDQRIEDQSSAEYTSAARPRVQQTTPKVGDSIAIPVPTEEQFNRDLDKVIRRKKRR